MLNASNLEIGGPIGRDKREFDALEPCSHVEGTPNVEDLSTGNLFSP